MSTEEKIIKLLKEDERVLIAELLNDEQKKEILKIEMKRLQETIPLINRSLQQAFDEEKAIVVIKDRTGIVIPDEELTPTLTLETDTGKIIGEEIYDPEELEDLRDDPEAYFISEHFVTYPNMPVAGEKQFFVVSELCNELENEDKIRESASSMVISAPSTEADHYIKDYYGISKEEKIVTIIIGFTE
ncbi:MAG: hypothetical protein IJJ47_05495 [Methanosphaera sp.]|nr:hypothetical protein [Methanosphaera sp.]